MVNDVEFALKYTYASWARPNRMPFLPTIIHLETTTKCNLVCTICPRTNTLSRLESRDEKRWNNNLSYEQFLGILEQFDSLRYIRLHGFGEPLMNPDLARFISEASSRGINAEFSSNATLLSADKAEALIKSGLFQLTVSIDGASKDVYEKIRINAQYETVIENLRQFVAIRSELNKERPYLRINIVVTADNIFELSDILKIAKSLGIKEVRASPIVPPHPDLNSLLPDVVLWKEATRKARRSAHQLGIDLICSGPSAQITGGKQSTGHSPNSKCKLPWLAPYIRVDGYVMPCCNTSDQRLLGEANIFMQDFYTIWNNNEFQDFRYRLKNGPLPEVCEKCPLV
jgi:MoaA/NifB/PqqE/SkfB family radical SAM enzyme